MNKRILTLLTIFLSMKTLIAMNPTVATDGDVAMKAAIKAQNMSNLQQAFNAGAQLNAPLFNTDRTHLHRAAKKGWLAGVTFLLNNGAQTSILDCDESTPLHLAAGNGHAQACTTLLNVMNAAEKNQLNCGQKTALTEAAIGGYRELIDPFIASGILINPPTLFSTLYHVVTSSSFSDSVTADAAYQMVIFLKGRGAVGHAQHGLIQHDPEYQRTMNQLNESLKKAIDGIKQTEGLERKRRMRWAKSLLIAGAEPHKNAFYEAEEAKYPRLLVLLAKAQAKHSSLQPRGSKELIEQYFRTKLAQSHERAVADVCSAWPSADMQADSFGRSALHVAARNNCTGLVRVFINKQYEQDNSGMTVLMHALLHGSPQIALLFERVSDDKCFMTDFHGNTLLYYALQGCNAEYFVKILERMERILHGRFQEHFVFYNVPLDSLVYSSILTLLNKQNSRGESILERLQTLVKIDQVAQYAPKNDDDWKASQFTGKVGVANILMYLTKRNLTHVLPQAAPL